MRSLWIWIAPLFLSLSAQASERLHSKFQVLRSQEEVQSWALAVEEKAFDQKLDHFNLFDRRHFKERYWISRDLARGPDSPTLFYICGETACSEGDVQFMAPWADLIHANIVVIEHRFYGQSHPFEKLNAQTLKYLRVDQTLADFAAILHDLRSHAGLNGPIIAAGGSYSGMLSSSLRLKYPWLIAGAWSSSGPMNIYADYQGYDQIMTSVMGQKCADRLREVIAVAEKAVQDPTAFAELRHRFGADDLTDPDDFLFSISDVAAAAVQYRRTANLCIEMDSDPDAVKAFINFLAYIADNLGYTPSAYSFASATDDTAGGPASDLRTFFYQQCTELGLFQTASKDATKSVRSQRLDIAYMRRGCERLFGKGLADTTEKFRRNYYQPMLDRRQSSEIFFTNGALDPFAGPGIAGEFGNWTNTRVYADLISTGSHCDELSFKRTPDDPHKYAHAQVELLLKKWAIPR